MGNLEAINQAAHKRNCNEPLQAEVVQHQLSYQVTQRIKQPADHKVVSEGANKFAPAAGSGIHYW